jgi:hypothetical protein
MHLGKFTIGEWDSSTRKPTQWKEIIAEQVTLNECVVDAGHIKVNGVSLAISGENVFVHLEKTRCNECGHENKWCAIPEYAVGDNTYSEFMKGLDRIPCAGCNKELQHRGVIWMEA